MEKTLRIYVHIPFCQSKCVYCDFASFVCGDEIKKRYFDKLCRDICSSAHAGRWVSSIYFGGGTPSSVDAGLIEKVLRCIRKTFVVKDDAEISIECNPASNSLEKLKKYRQMGINRLSFGVQSLSNKTLKFLHRRHNKREVKLAILDAKKAGFENVSADLIIGVDGGKTLTRNAKKLIGYGVTHLSAYMLQIEENTPLFDMVKNKKVRKKLKFDDQCVKIYDDLAKFLAKRGFERYEISNFCKPGFECKHNMGYWNLDEYLGFGLAAHSYVDGKRIANSRNFDDFFAGKNIKIESLSKSEQIEEKIMLCLRTSRGVNLQELEKMGYQMRQNKNFANLLARGILLENDGFVAINPQFFGVSNQIIVKLLPDE